MNKFLNLQSINSTQRDQYIDAIRIAFPPIIGESPVIKKYWSKLEEYFPEHQILLISEDEELIGFINTVPFYFEHELSHLPDRGWDWMFTKGITDFENSIHANYLGGLQVIVRSKFQKQGYSKIILDHIKSTVPGSQFNNLTIPIRPTKKHEFPSIPMSEYIKLKNGEEVYDPWIRTHINGGAKIIKVCEQSMIMEGNVDFWETMLNQTIYKSGSYILSGALSLISIDFENDKGIYVEPNIWINY